MPNTSATGGYLLPTNYILDGQALKDFVHDLLVGITGLDNTLVRPAYQRLQPTIPSFSVNWLAFHIADRRVRNVNQLVPGDDSATQTVQEDMDILCSFYGDNCTLNAGILRDGIYINQNQEVLTLNGFGLRGTSETRYLPGLLNEQYLERCDVTITLTREIQKDYSILPLLTGQGIVIAETAEGSTTENWET